MILNLDLSRGKDRASLFRARVDAWKGCKGMGRWRRQVLASKVNRRCAATGGFFDL